MKRIWMLIICLFPVFLYAQIQGPAGGIKTNTVTQLNAHTPDLTDDQAPLGYVVNATGTAELRIWDTNTGTWILTGDGIGTDDQTATEVTVTATGFTGNLSATDTDVQTALSTIDALALGTDTQALGVGSNGITLVNGGSVTTDAVIKQLKGPFTDNAAAGVGGVAIGEYYILSADNPYGEPDGETHKRK